MVVLRTNAAELDYADAVVGLQRGGSLLAMARGRRRLRLRHWLLWAVALALLLFSHFFTEPIPGRERYPLGRLLLGLTVTGGPVLAGVLLANRLFRWSTPKMMRRPREGEMEIEIGEKGFRFRTARHAAFYAWSFCDRLAETDRSFAMLGKRLGASFTTIMTIPKSACSDQGQLGSLRELLTQNVLPEATMQRGPGGGFPVGPDTETPTSQPCNAGFVQQPQLLLDRVDYRHTDFDVAVTGWWRKAEHPTVWPKVAIGTLAAGMVAGAAGSI